MKITIRKAKADDVKALVAIEEESFVRPHWDADSFLKFDCVVAELEGRIGGFLVSREIFPSHNGVGPEREILNIAVAPVYRRMGVATLLLKHERDNGATHYLEVRESNSGAQALYRKLGFVEIGRRPEYYDFPRETAIVMHMK